MYRKGSIKELNTTQAWIDIAITLFPIQLSYYEDLYGKCLQNNVVKMKDRCIVCGAGDDSMNNPDYSDWVCVVIMYLSVYMIT